MIINIKELNKTISNIKEISKIKDIIIIEKRSGNIYKYGDDTYYDMEIENYICCPKGMENDFFGFCKNDYELIIKSKYNPNL